MSAATHPENASTLDCRALRPEHVPGLTRLFERLKASGMEKLFHPHPLTEDEAARRAHYSGRDSYCVGLSGNMVVAYGMLRGWDEGYEVPSLGIAVDPALHGRGYGRRLMAFLHEIARQRGANKIRLKVHPDNRQAIGLYRSLGYVFGGDEGGKLIGFLDLKFASGSPHKENTK